MQNAPKKELSLFDSTCLIMGIIIGTGIFVFGPNVARGTGSWWGALGFWAAGGLISLFGALGYAELATAYPREGGDYVYLGRAYGRWAGFLFGWLQLTVVRPGDIAVMAFAFATYAVKLYDPFPGTGYPYSLIVYACGATLALTAVNVLGVRQGKWTQNLLTSAKVIGLLAIIAVAVFAPRGASSATAYEPFPLSLAMIFVLFTFGGWNEMAYVAAEVKNPERNIVRALILGTVAVTVIYLLVNAAFFYALGFSGVASSKAIATDTISTVFPVLGGSMISVLVCISALGTLNGQIFTGARISYAMGADHRVFRHLGKWHDKTGTPIPALLLQGAIAIGLILVLGSLVDSIVYTAPAVYTFYMATSLAVIILRDREPQTKRPFRVTWYPLYPLTTFVFCGVCAFLIYSAVIYKPWVAAGALGIALAGLPIYWLSKFWPAGRPEEAGPQRGQNP